MRDMKNSQENKALLVEVRNELDAEVASLDFPVRSRLRQARFHAIDHGSLASNKSSFDISRYIAGGVTVATALAVSLTFMMNPFGFAVTSNDPVPANQLPGHEKLNTVETADDTKEDIEIYNWLYEHYG